MIRLFFSLFLAVVCLAADTPKAAFRNVGKEAGLTDIFPNGGSESKRYILETTGGGAGWIDYDNDGLLDALVTSGKGGSNRLYRNLGDGHFEDVTKKTGIESTGWNEGVCAGDYDNDGWTDLMITAYGHLNLFHNRDGKRFDDATQKSGLRQERPRYNTGCTFLDYDKDGFLDLFVVTYLNYDSAVAFEPGSNPYCFYRGLAVNCGPRGLDFDTNQLFHNNGDGTFTDVSQAAGITEDYQNYPLGVLTGDFDEDGWTDIYIACDVTPGLLYMNQGDGTFSEEGLLRGVAFNENGRAMSGMGVTAADYDRNGWLDIFRSNFSDERDTLYRNLGEGDFEEVTATAGLGRNTRFVSWGCGFFDYDNDGDEDLFLASGHVFPEVDRLQIDVRARDRKILFRNNGDGAFTDISEQAGPGVLEINSSRGVAFGDMDNDGLLEILINNQNDRPSLLVNEQGGAGHWILIKLTGTRSNRSAIGAQVKLTAGGVTQTDEVRSGGSFISQSDFRLHFGLGAAEKIGKIEIRWPSGTTQVLKGIAVDRVLAVREPEQ